MGIGVDDADMAPSIDFDWSHLKYTPIFLKIKKATMIVKVDEDYGKINMTVIAEKNVLCP